MDANTWRDMILLKITGSSGSQKTFPDKVLSAVANEAINKFIASKVFPERNSKQIGIDGSPKRDIDLGGIISATTTYSLESDHFILGSRANGALRLPDFDAQISPTGVDPTDKFGVFVSIPDECYHIISILATMEKDSVIFDPVLVEQKSHTFYNNNIFNSYIRPDTTRIWAIDFGNYSTGTFAAPISTKNMTGQSAYLNPSTNQRTSVTFTTNRIHNIIVPKGFTLLNYNIAYIKTPAQLVISTSRPELQVNCDLHEAVHYEVIDIAVDILSKLSIPIEQRVQLTDATTKNQD